MKRNEKKKTKANKSRPLTHTHIRNLVDGEEKNDRIATETTEKKTILLLERKRRNLVPLNCQRLTKY